MRWVDLIVPHSISSIFGQRRPGAQGHPNSSTDGPVFARRPGRLAEQRAGVVLARRAAAASGHDPGRRKPPRYISGQFVSGRYRPIANASAERPHISTTRPMPAPVSKVHGNCPPVSIRPTTSSGSVGPPRSISSGDPIWGGPSSISTTWRTRRSGAGWRPWTAAPGRRCCRRPHPPPGGHPPGPAKRPGLAAIPSGHRPFGRYRRPLQSRRRGHGRVRQRCRGPQRLRTTGTPRRPGRGRPSSGGAVPGQHALRSEHRCTLWFVSRSLR